MTLPAETRPGAVTLRVADLDTVAAFYAGALGLGAVERDGERVALGARAGVPLVELLGDSGAAPRPPGTTGLFHQALLVPGRPELAAAIHRVAAAGGRLTGAADHLVSEAVYLDDPEGNGIEIYRDRPREEWRWDGGELRIGTIPLDLDGVLAALPPGDPAAVDSSTVMGHVHLTVADLAASEAFYVDALGFEVTVRGFPGALFISAGGYHHHLGLNTWTGPGAPPPPAGSRGLERFEVLVPDRAALDAAADRLAAAGVAIARDVDGALLVTDPSGNRLRVRA